MERSKSFPPQRAQVAPCRQQQPWRPVWGLRKSQSARLIRSTTTASDVHKQENPRKRQHFALRRNDQHAHQKHNMCQNASRFDALFAPLNVIRLEHLLCHIIPACSHDRNGMVRFCGLSQRFSPTSHLRRQELQQAADWLNDFLDSIASRTLPIQVVWEIHSSVGLIREEECRDYPSATRSYLLALWVLSQQPNLFSNEQLAVTLYRLGSSYGRIGKHEQMRTTLKQAFDLMDGKKKPMEVASKTSSLSDDKSTRPRAGRSNSKRRSLLKQLGMDASARHPLWTMPEEDDEEDDLEDESSYYYEPFDYSVTANTMEDLSSSMGSDFVFSPYPSTTTTTVSRRRSRSSPEE